MELRSLAVAAITAFAICSCTKPAEVTSPDGRVGAIISAKPYSTATLTITIDGETLIEGIELGLSTAETDFSRGMTIASVSSPRAIVDDYMMLTGKRAHCVNHGREITVGLRNPDGRRLNIELRAYPDGVAWRYSMPEATGDTLIADLTTYPIANGTRRWISSYDPTSYERFYPLATDGSDIDKRQNGRWAYPALIEPKDSLFMLLTEGEILRGHCATYLSNTEHSTRYATALGSDSLPMRDSVWTSPWKIVIAGSLANVVESTLVTDLAEPSLAPNADWVKPGVASWAYWAYNHGANDASIVNRYTDLAVDMRWPYTLIDAEWDEMQGGHRVEEVIDYANARGIKPMIWYNSTTGWIDGAPGPKWRLNNAADREREFMWLDSVGIKGVKIDFFNGDGVETMDYCLDLLDSALAHKLMVTLHGATIPRGWQRTYPNLMTVEGVYGAEWYNNKPVMTTRAAAHNATLPFTRNVVGPMDYTPGTFTDSQHPHITTHAHELALTLLFESALQHMPDRPEGYASLPTDVRELLSTIPTAWDDTRLLSGYPAEWVVLARRKGNDWYIAGINGLDCETTLAFSLSRLNNVDGKQMTIFADGETQLEFAPTSTIEVNGSDWIEFPCRPRGGFVAVLK